MRKQLGKDEKEALNATVLERFGIVELINKKQPAELIDENGVKRIMIEGRMMFVYVGEILVPTLKFLLTRQILPVIPVDMGAVKFITSGADVMRPGINTFPPDLKKDSLVCIVDEKHGKPLAVGQMMIDGDAAAAVTSGKIIKNLHWVGDTVWRL